MFDVFVAPLVCPACGTATPDAEIQTYIRNGSADSSSLPVGFELDAADLSTERVLGAGYVLIEPPGDTGLIRLLDQWICPACETEQWAAIEIAGLKVRRIEAVTLDRKTLEAANFIDETDAELLAESFGGDASDSVSVLRQHLPVHG